MNIAHSQSTGQCKKKIVSMWSPCTSHCAEYFIFHQKSPILQGKIVRRSLTPFPENLHFPEWESSTGGLNLVQSPLFP